MVQIANHLVGLPGRLLAEDDAGKGRALRATAKFGVFFDFGPEPPVDERFDDVLVGSGHRMLHGRSQIAPQRFRQAGHCDSAPAGLARLRGPERPPEFIPSDSGPKVPRHASPEVIDRPTPYDVRCERHV